MMNYTFWWLKADKDDGAENHRKVPGLGNWTPDPATLDAIRKGKRSCSNKRGDQGD